MATIVPILLAILLGSLLLSALFWWLGARLMKAPKARFGRALLATFILYVLAVLFVPASFWLGTAAGQNILIVLFFEAALGLMQLFIAWIVLQRCFETTFPRAIAIWAINLVPTAVMFVAIFLSLKLFLMEAYIVPTNAMAPTIIGHHREDVCPHCRGKIIVTASDPLDPFALPINEERPGICEKCRKSTDTFMPTSPLVSPDRILVNKLLKPERWDIIVFRYPPEPTQKYVMRLVALPGETVYIDNGSVWINDAKLALPTELAGQQYTVERNFMRYATKEEPFRLGPDEYFVLGDFSRNSSDSRNWGPVPGANIEGVVCLCYWPQERWRVYR